MLVVRVGKASVDALPKCGRGGRRREVGKDSGLRREKARAEVGERRSPSIAPFGNPFMGHRDDP